MMDFLKGYQLVSVSTLLYTSALLCIFQFLRTKFTYWSSRGIPSISLLESLIRAMRFYLGLDSFSSSYLGLYQTFEGHKYGGTYELLTPVLILRDPKLVRNFLIEGFSQIHDRMPALDEDLNRLSTHLFRLTGDKWRQVRHKLSPAFSPARLKNIFFSLKECADDYDAHLRKLMEKTGSVEVNGYEFLSNYTLDAIWASVMGVKTNSAAGGDKTIKKYTHDFITFDFRRLVYRVLELINPKLPSLLKWKLVPSDLEQFFLKTCKDTATFREHKSASEKDFIQFFMNIRNSEDNLSDPLFSDELIASNIAFFLNAGLEPIGVLLTYCLHEIASNSEIQEKIYNEIQTVRSENNNEITFESLKSLQYTTQVINETLRLHPVAPVVFREITEPFKLPDSDAVIDKNTKLYISLHGLHHDPKYFPDPFKFDPDRFSEENKQYIVPGTYMPFGDGPRFCIANRFVLLNAKTLVVTLLSNYTVHTRPKVQKKLEYDPSTFSSSPVGGLYLSFKRRENS